MVERSAGAIVFYKGHEGIEYLLLRHEPLNPRIQAGKKEEYWNFPKGRIEKGETSEETTLREIHEETGLASVDILPGFKETERYVYSYQGEKIYKWVAWFLAESASKKVILSPEHIDFCWLQYEEAAGRITYSQGKKLLAKADAFLSIEK
jgi:8-oxo-dGTP pyrophosphatase MutT (NUDIX family)